MKSKFVMTPDPNREPNPIKRAEKSGQAKMIGKVKGKPVFKLQNADAEALRQDIASVGGLAIGAAMGGYQPPIPMTLKTPYHTTPKSVTQQRDAWGSAPGGEDRRDSALPEVDYSTSHLSMQRPTGLWEQMQAQAPTKDTVAQGTPSRIGIDSDSLTRIPRLGPPPPPPQMSSDPSGMPSNPARDAYTDALGQYAQHVAQGPPGMQPNIDPEDMRQAMLLDRLRKTGTYNTGMRGLGNQQVYDPVRDQMGNRFNVGVDTRTRAQRQGGQVIPFVDPALERRFGPAEQRVLEAMQAPGQALERYMQQGKGLESYMDRLKPLGLDEPRVPGEPKGPTSLEQMLVQAKSPEEQQQILDMMRRQSEATRAPRGGEDGGGGYSKQEKVDMEQHILAIEDAMNDPGTSPEDRAALQADADKLNAALRGADYVVAQRQSKTQREESARRQAESDALASEDRGMRMQDRARSEQDRMMSQDVESSEGEGILNDIVSQLEKLPPEQVEERLASMQGKELSDLQRKYGRTMLASGEKDLSPQNVRAFVLAELNRRRAAPNPVGLIPGRSDPIGEETSGSVRQDYEDAVGANQYNPLLMQERALQKFLGMDPRTGILRYLYERGRGAVNRFMGRNQR